MQLHSTITSPYARKVWVFAHETGLIKDIQRIPTNPHVDEYLREDNPLCRVPHVDPSQLTSERMIRYPRSFLPTRRSMLAGAAAVSTISFFRCHSFAVLKFKCFLAE
jgi:hypothetical protein